MIKNSKPMIGTEKQTKYRNITKLYFISLPIIFTLNRRDVATWALTHTPQIGTRQYEHQCILGI